MATNRPVTWWGWWRIKRNISALQFRTQRWPIEAKQRFWIVNSILQVEKKLSVEDSFHFCTMMRTFLCPSIQLHNNIYWRCHPSHCFLTKQYQATLLLTLTSCPKYRPKYQVNKFATLLLTLTSCSKYQVNKTLDQDPAGKPLLHWYGCMGKKHFWIVWGPDNFCVLVLFTVAYLCTHHIPLPPYYHKVISHSHSGIFLATIKGT